MIAYLISGLRRTLCLSLLMLGSVRSMAQETIDFSPDAPGATTGVDIMKQGKIDWETGIGLEWGQEERRTRTYLHYQHIYVSTRTDTSGGSETTD